MDHTLTSKTAHADFSYEIIFISSCTRRHQRDFESHLVTITLAFVHNSSGRLHIKRSINGKEMKAHSPTARDILIYHVAREGVSIDPVIHVYDRSCHLLEPCCNPEFGQTEY